MIILLLSDYSNSRMLHAAVCFRQLAAYHGLSVDLTSLITAIIAALLLVEIINALDIERQYKINLNIAACFAIGLGAVLTPIGEPLSTIAVSKMNGDFWYLLRLIGVYILPGVIACRGYPPTLKLTLI